MEEESRLGLRYEKRGFERGLRAKRERRKEMREEWRKEKRREEEERDCDNFKSHRHGFVVTGARFDVLVRYKIAFNFLFSLVWCGYL